MRKSQDGFRRRCSRSERMPLSRLGMKRVVCTALLATAITLSANTSEAAPQKADSILILKRDHVMELLAGGRVFRTYKVALGRGGLEPKQSEGDARTPEGHYTIDSRNTASRFYKALHISGCRGSQAGGKTRRCSWRSHHDPWPSKWNGMAWRCPPRLRLDGWLRGSHRRGDGRDMESRPRWNAGRDSPMIG
jgi:hypothetical protein